MSKDAKNNAPDMDSLRADIDQVDGALLELIAKRMDLARAVRRAKSGVNLWRPSREESHVRNLAKKAAGTSPALVSRIWAELTSASLSLQGPLHLHIALIGDELSARTMVRDRFGASIPSSAYPTASAALAAAQADPEGVAVLPAPGGMNNWWTALGPKGGAANMHILAALPRIGAWHWPAAVAVSKAAMESSGDDMSLIYLQTDSAAAPKTPLQVFAKYGVKAVLRAEMDGRSLLSVDGFISESDAIIARLKIDFKTVKIIGVLPSPILIKDNAP